MIIVPVKKNGEANEPEYAVDKPYIQSICDGTNYYYLETEEDAGDLPAVIQKNMEL